MEERLIQITEIIKSMPEVTINIPFIQLMNGDITGSFTFKEGGIELSFDLTINMFYPFQFHNNESIKFSNEDLVKYNHVMKDGSICIHTSHSPNLKDKLYYDFDSLRNWIKKYYIGKENDYNYEHIIVPTKSFKGINFCYLFTEVEHEFKPIEFGYTNYSFLNQGLHNENKINTYIIQSFELGQKTFPSKWNDIYKKRETGTGVYIFIGNAPVTNGRFAVEKWNELEPYVNQAFMQLLKNVGRDVEKNNVQEPLPLFFGYNIPGGEIHWECAAIEVNNFPITERKVPNSRIYEIHFKDEEINWLQTKNSSYKYFFGRGTLSKKIIDKKILIIGIGAIGSNLATTLVRGGCTDIHLADYDIKEPENVCRSEYQFFSGLNSKVIDLGRQLSDISPFVNPKPFERLTDVIKFLISNGFEKKETIERLDEYDYIFDCSTDNDLAYILDSLNLKAEVINISITNHAKELVCAIKPNLYECMNEIFKGLNSDENDLYNPTGCWSPTFKASYNDIASMTQIAIKHINILLEKNLSLRSFYLQAGNESELNFKIHQF